MPTIDFSKNVEAQVAEFEELLSNLRGQYVKGNLSTEQVEWFKNLSSRQREELMNPNHVKAWRQRLRNNSEDKVAPHHK